MELAALKWEGQYPRLKHALAMFKIFFKQLLSETKGLRYFQEIWSSLGNEDDEHLAIVSLSSWLEKKSYSIVFAWGISLRKQSLIGLFLAKL